MIRRVLVAALLAVAAPAMAKPRVASINMCTDQLVLALADDDQILGVSALARDPALSFYHDRARRFPSLSGTAEDAMLLRPDVVATSGFAKPYTRALLANGGVAVETFEDARNLDDVRRQILRMGRLLDQAERAAAAVARIDEAERRARMRPSPPLSILPLERRGWITGRDTLLTDLLGRAGHVNMGARFDAYGARLPLEIIAAQRPDRLLLTAAAGRSEDQGSALLLHPALAGLRARGVIMMPERLLVCAGPMQAEAIDLLSAAVAPARR